MHVSEVWGDCGSWSDPRCLCSVPPRVLVTRHAWADGDADVRTRLYGSLLWRAWHLTSSLVSTPATPWSVSSGRAGPRWAPPIPSPLACRTAWERRNSHLHQASLVKDRSGKQLLRKCCICVWSSPLPRQWLWNLAGCCHHPGNLVNSWDSLATLLEHLGRCDRWSSATLTAQQPFTVLLMNLISSLYIIKLTSVTIVWYL